MQDSRIRKGRTSIEIEKEKSCLMTQDGVLRHRRAAPLSCRLTPGRCVLLPVLKGSGLMMSVGAVPLCCGIFLPCQAQGP